MRRARAKRLIDQKKINLRRNATPACHPDGRHYRFNLRFDPYAHQLGLYFHGFEVHVVTPPVRATHLCTCPHLASADRPASVRIYSVVLPQNLHLPSGPSSFYVAHLGRAAKIQPMKRLIYRIVLLGLIFCVVPRPAVAQEPYLGEIRTFAFNFCPTGWASLDGQLLPISEYTALFSLLGATYGGNGTTTFALPKWGPIFAASGGTLLPCIALQGVYPSRN
jgi:hypothetical protein